MSTSYKLAYLLIIISIAFAINSNNLYTYSLSCINNLPFSSPVQHVEGSKIPSTFKLQLFSATKLHFCSQFMNKTDLEVETTPYTSTLVFD